VVLFGLRMRLGPGPLVAVLIFVGTLVPALGFVNVFPMRYTFVADHYQYHASVALIALLAAAATLAWRKRARGGRAWVGPILGVAVVAVLFVLTWRRAGVYRDQRTLWTDTVERNPGSWMAWINLGQAARQARPPDLAAVAAANRRALALASDVADTHFEMAQTYVDESNYPAAIAELERTVAIEPRHAEGYNLMGSVLRRMNQPAQALPWLEKAIELAPLNWRAHANLGRALEDLGRLDEAAGHFALSLEFNPRQAEALRELANCYIKTRRYPQAEAPLRRLVEMRPDDADSLFDLGIVLRFQQRFDEAQPFLLKAFSIKPELQNRLQGKR
jgi:tetratricopeptide (TPR) repeat protein